LKDTFDAECTFAGLVAKIAKKLGHLKNTFYLGCSLGGYIAYHVAHLLGNFLKLDNIRKLALFSVGDFNTLPIHLTIDELKVQFEKVIYTNDIELQEHILEEILSDIVFLRSLKDFSGKTILQPLIIFYGKRDELIEWNSSAEEFWKTKTKNEYAVYDYDGRHLPSHEDLIKIIQILLLQQSAEDKMQ